MGSVCGWRDRAIAAFGYFALVASDVPHARSAPYLRMPGNASRQLTATLGSTTPVPTVVMGPHAPTTTPQPTEFFSNMADGPFERNELTDIARRSIPQAWPSETVASTNAAWTNGRQPRNLELWPKGEDGVSLGPCWLIQVVADTATNWPGQCEGLYETSEWDGHEITSELECETACRNRPECTVWQFTGGYYPTCYLSWEDYYPTTHCEGRSGYDVSVTRSQRIQHGAVRVLSELRDIQIMGLYNLGVFQGDDADVGSVRCKRWCYSYVKCQYWQYGAGGCWVEIPESYVTEYPMTIGSGAERDSVFARTVHAGEYIQHYCPDAQGSTVPPPPPPRPPPVSMWAKWSTWIWIIWIALVMVALGVGVFYFMNSSRRKRRPRVAKAAPPEPAEPETQSFNETASMTSSLMPLTMNAVPPPMVGLPGQTSSFTIGPVQPGFAVPLASVGSPMASPRALLIR